MNEMARWRAAGRRDLISLSARYLPIQSGGPPAFCAHYYSDSPPNLDCANLSESPPPGQLPHPALKNTDHCARLQIIFTYFT